MKNFELDQNGIYINDSKNYVSYHDDFNDICFEVEESNFWFNNRNAILEKIIRNFSSKTVFADVGGGQWVPNILFIQTVFAG
jgi:hypothetical protein